jgi:hypothetical protein
MYFSAYSRTAGREFWVYTGGNSAPMITAASAVTIAPGTGQNGVTLANVSDMQDAAGSLVVTATVVPAGILVTSITNTNGVITADINVTAGAALGANQVTLQVQDLGGLTASAQFTVNVGSGGGVSNGGGGGGGGGGCAALGTGHGCVWLGLLLLALVWMRSRSNQRLNRNRA